MSNSPPPIPDPGRLPQPEPAALAVSQRLERQIEAEIDRSGGRIPFDRFMELALYAPGLGYYVAGSRKFGEAGDFITAPEVSPLFGRCLARQARELLQGLGGGEILEFGAGSGRLAVDLLLELERLGQLPERYLILEVSPELRERQRARLQASAPGLLERVVWLQGLPSGFNGLVIANELLDAMPVSRFRIGAEGPQECFVGRGAEGFTELFLSPGSPGLQAAVEAIEGRCGGLATGYVSEVNLRQGAWLQALGEAIERGLVLLIDYGLPGCEYYHAQRQRGTLMCHYRHRAHADPFRWVGLQDITSHVDFSAVAEQAGRAGFELAGYTTQAHFLLASGLDQMLAGSDPGDLVAHMALVQGVKRLTLPAEMGERFKVLGLARGDLPRISGFALRDLRDRL